MRFEKGVSGNIKGRPKKVPLTTEQIRELIKDTLAGLAKDLSKDMKTLRPKDRLILFEKLLRYVLPGPEFDLSKLSDKDLDLLIEKLKAKEVTNSPKTPERIGSPFVIN